MSIHINVCTNIFTTPFQPWKLDLWRVGIAWLAFQDFSQETSKHHLIVNEPNAASRSSKPTREDPPVLTMKAPSSVDTMSAVGLLFSRVQRGSALPSPGRRAGLGHSAWWSIVQEERSDRELNGYAPSVSHNDQSYQVGLLSFGGWVSLVPQLGIVGWWPSLVCLLLKTHQPGCMQRDANCTIFL